MQFYSTNKKSDPVSLSYAILKGLADDGGLYMPQTIPVIDRTFFEELHKKSLPEIGLRVANAFLGEDIPEKELQSLVEDALSFPIPLVKLRENIDILELFHGPTMAFKDVGARFMSRIMAWLLRNENKPLKVVVATSGDTGSAVAAGFYEVPGIEVYVLFPKGRVSPLQQKQITTWGKNIRAIEVNGNFDDCQAMVKKVLSDQDLNRKHLITSANSINIARLIPQSFYYLYAFAQLQDKTKPVVFSVPSGNFGNLGAGLLAQKMGLQVSRFIAANNDNDAAHRYYKNGLFMPLPTVQTISNAMDVGNPSNLARIFDLYHNNHQTFCNHIYGCSFTDQQTSGAILSTLQKHHYLLDPHGAVALLGAEQYLQEENANAQIIMLETAHPAKFTQTLEIHMKLNGQLPHQLEKVSQKEEIFQSIDNQLEVFMEILEK